MDAELVTDARRLEELADAWDALAVQNALPMSAPAWALGWLRHMAPADLELRVLALYENGEMVAIAPFFAQLRRGWVVYELLAVSIGPKSPLAVPGREWDAARTLSEMLAAARPRPDVVKLATTPVGPWASALRHWWPGRAKPVLWEAGLRPCPVVTLADDFETWMEGRSANFRSQMRRMRRRMGDAGGVSRMSTPERFGDDLDAFLRLHAARWEGRGRSTLAEQAAGYGAALKDMAHNLPAGRARLWMIDVDREPVSAQLFIAAGGEVLYFNGGWDERFAHFKPAMLGILDAIEDAHERRDRRVDLGPEAFPYKLRFTSDQAILAAPALIVLGPHLVSAAAARTPQLVQIAAKRLRA